ncbi:MAG: peptidyl-tRNA hydrolase [Flavobacteriales endosymbiont of Rhyzopertha dominica]|nr:MAG: aminoacyl-tRNA hydrolase [Candidatus Shikimatogenerans bostrichidophilus]
MINNNNNKYLIIGIGNPNKKYKYTRHNIGNLIVKNLLFNKNKKEIINNKYGKIYIVKYYKIKLLLLFSKNYINKIGITIKYFFKKLKLNNNNLIIISDDIYMKFGKVKLKFKGGSGGHNGLKSIENNINTKNYIRIKIGIGNKFKYGNQNKYVLENFNINELKIIYNKIYYLVYNKIINIIKF